MKKILLFLIAIVFIGGASFILLGRMGFFSASNDPMDYVFYDDAQSLIKSLENNEYILKENNNIGENELEYTYSHSSGSEQFSISFTSYQENYIKDISLYYDEIDKDLVIDFFDILIANGAISNEFSGESIYDMILNVNVPEYENFEFELNNLNARGSNSPKFNTISFNMY